MQQNTRLNQLISYLKTTPNDTFLRYAIATEYVALGEDSKALQIYKELVIDEPEYFATYYHLGKLYERINEDILAEQTYEIGMKITKELGEKHAYGELRGAFEELTF